MKRTMIILILFCLILTNACKKNLDRFDSEIVLKVDTEIEKTTHIFTFKATTEDPVPSSDKIYCRFDWDSDSVWDTPFSQDLEVHHRFYVPGTYKIHAEFLTKSGYMQFDSIEIAVERGFSSPKPDFQVIPLSSHFMTDFIFDASLTKDDEDSLETLQFRWDFYNDGDWDTGYLDSVRTSFRFITTGKFQIKMEAKDPSNRSQYVLHWVDVHRTDTMIRPVLKINPLEGSVVDTFLFDASESYHSNDPEQILSYSWKFTNSGFTFLSPDSAVIQRIFQYPGPMEVILIVVDENELQNSLSREFYVSLGNRPPTAFFETPIPYGNIQTQFYFSVWGSRDDHNSVSELEKRWDFDGDGIWDTPFAYDMEYYHQYGNHGTYQPTLQVKDKEGLTNTVTHEIKVSSYTNPTGFVRDERDNKLYGTVKIGNFWWMSENLDFRPDAKMKLFMLQKCYNEDEKLCDQYGSLYLPDRVYDFEKNGKGVCPTGWHVPTKREMGDLGDNLPKTNSREALEIGGSMGFNAQYSGKGNYIFIYDIHGNVVDTTWSFRNLDLEGFASSLDYSFSTGRVLNLQFSKKSSEAWVFTYPGKNDYFSIRCVKD